MPTLLTNLGDALFDILFPPLCLLCRKSLASGEKLDALCEACAGAIPLRSAFHCAVCDARLPSDAMTCHVDAPYRIAAAASYRDNRIKHLIWQLKYEKRTASARALGALLAKYIAPLADEFKDAVLVPIPLHRSRLRERGFNQSELIAEEVNRRTGLRLERNLLIRVRQTKPQAECRERNERAANIAACFTVNPRAALPKNPVVLVDDVATSGATLAEAAACLKRSGVLVRAALVAAKA